MKVSYLLIVFGLLCFTSASAQPSSNPCCDDCTCTLCGEQLSCGFLNASDCDEGGTAVCGNDGDSLTTDPVCSVFWQNTSLYPAGVDRGDGASDNCIPIDSGLGFLIVGGLFIGMFGFSQGREGRNLSQI